MTAIGLAAITFACTVLKPNQRASCSKAPLPLAFLIAAMSVGAAVFLILELDGPFEGLIRISAEPFRQALINLGH